MKKLYIYLIMLVFIGCSHTGTLNLQKHAFGVLPSKIIWIQVAGLSENHISLLKFSLPHVNSKTSFEMAKCIGKTWHYNLFKIRPNANQSFMSQITGKENFGLSKNKCDLCKERPIWDYLKEVGLKTAIFESQTKNKNFSFENCLSCNDASKMHLEDIILWKMEKKDKKSKAIDFHVLEKKSYKAGNIYYDSSCRSGVCQTSLLKNIKHTFKNFSKNEDRYLFMLRDFSYYDALKEKNIKKAKNILFEIERIYAYFLDIVNSSNRTLLILSTAEPIGIEFPKAGSGWDKLGHKKKGVFYKSSLLMGPIFANGPLSQNFCGMYTDADIFIRLLHGPQDKQLKREPRMKKHYFE